MNLYLASGNPHKVAELQALADASAAGGGPAVRVLSAAAAGGMPPVVEDTGTFAGNAEKKVRALAAHLPPGSWALADDSGLCVEALHGGPGVESAYYAGPQGDPAANLARLVADLAGVPDHQRAAKFVCTLALLGPDGHLHLFTGECAGRLARWPRGDRGFGYDPLFIPAGFDRTLGELDGETKNALSHRGRAWADCFAWLAARG